MKTNQYIKEWRYHFLAHSFKKTILFIFVPRDYYDFFSTICIIYLRLYGSVL